MLRREDTSGSDLFTHKAAQRVFYKTKRTQPPILMRSSVTRIAFSKLVDALKALTPTQS